MVVISTVIVYALELHQDGVEIIGDVPSGLPSARDIFVNHGSEEFFQMIPTAALIHLVGFMVSITVAKNMQLRFGNVVKSNQELIGLGAANLVGSFFSCVPVAGSFSRSSINANAGAKSPLAGIFTGVVLLITVQYLTGLLYYLPSVSLLIVAALLPVFEVEQHFKFTLAGLPRSLDHSCCSGNDRSRNNEAAVESGPK